jgi:hypothetical protein
VRARSDKRTFLRAKICNEIRMMNNSFTRFPLRAETKASGVDLHRIVSKDTRLVTRKAGVVETADHSKSKTERNVICYRQWKGENFYQNNGNDPPSVP